MRKLTFEGFLKQYVAELSGVQTASIHRLADCLSENPRLKEPLFLYALAYDKVDLLLRYTCLLYTSPSPRDMRRSRMPSSA